MMDRRGLKRKNLRVGLILAATALLYIGAVVGYLIAR
jgi:hypothetical protein